MGTTVGQPWCWLARETVFLAEETVKEGWADKHSQSQILYFPQQKGFLDLSDSTRHV